MADLYKKTRTILLRVNGKKTSIELFPAEQWPKENTGENLFRLRINGKFYCPMGKYTFFTLFAIGEISAKILAGEELSEPVSLPEWAQKGREIKADYGECCEGIPLKSYHGYIIDEPQLALNGRYYALCQLNSLGWRFIPVDDLKPFRR